MAKGKRRGAEVTIDQAEKDAEVAQYDAFLIPGGYFSGSVARRPRCRAFYQGGVVQRLLHHPLVGA